MYTAFSDNIITLNAVHNVSIYTTECVTSSVQHEMASMCWEKAIGAPSLSHPFKEDQVLPLSMPWLKLLNMSDLLRCKLPVMVALPDGLSAWWFPFTPACPGQYTHSSFGGLSSMSDCFHLQCQAGGWDSLSCTVFMDGGRTSLDSEAPPRLFFYDWAVSVLYELLWLCHFLDWEAWSLALFCLLFACFLAGVSHRDARYFWIPFPLLGLLELCQLAYL